MSTEERSFRFLPGAGVAIVSAIVLFTVYAWRAGPVVPAPVAMLVQRYAPSVAIHSSVRESSRQLTDRQWTRGLGYVGTPRDHRMAQVRLLLTPADRAGGGDDKAVVDAVELVSTRGPDIANVMSDIAFLFRANPTDGCLVPSNDAMPYRRVQFWTTRNNHGGVALVSDWPMADRPTATRNVAVWSFIAWAGAFAGSSTLRARFDPRSCRDVAANPVPALPADAAALAGEALTLALGGQAR